MSILVSRVCVSGFLLAALLACGHRASADDDASEAMVLASQWLAFAAANDSSVVMRLSVDSTALAYSARLYENGLRNEAVERGRLRPLSSLADTTWLSFRPQGADVRGEIALAVVRVSGELKVLDAVPFRRD